MGADSIRKDRRNGLVGAVSWLHWGLLQRRLHRQYSRGSLLSFLSRGRNRWVVIRLAMAAMAAGDNQEGATSTSRLTPSMEVVGLGEGHPAVHLELGLMSMRGTKDIDLKTKAAMVAG